MSGSKMKLSEEFGALAESIRGYDGLIDSDDLTEWQQRAEYLETSLAQWQGEEYDLQEPLFVMQLGLDELDMLLDFINEASSTAWMVDTIPSATWKMLNEKVALLNIQVDKFNKQAAAELAASAGADNANT